MNNTEMYVPEEVEQCQTHRMTQDRDGNYVRCVICGLDAEQIETSQQ